MVIYCYTRKESILRLEDNLGFEKGNAGSNHELSRGEVSLEPTISISTTTSQISQSQTTKIPPSGVLSANPPTSDTDWETPTVKYGSDHCRAWINFSKRKRYSSTRTSRSCHYTLRPMATALLPRRRVAARLPIPLHIQHILQRAMAGSRHLGHFRERVS